MPEYTGLIILGVLQAVLFMWLGWVTKTISQISRHSTDLHTWHKPDDQGVQEWRGKSVREAVEEGTKAIRDLHVEFRGVREDFRSLAQGMENHAKREELVFSNLAEKLSDLKKTIVAGLGSGSRKSG